MFLQIWLDHFFLARDLRRTTEGRYRWSVNFFERWLGHPATLAELSERLNDFLREQDGNRHTLKGIRNALVAVLNAAAVAGLVPVPKARGVRTPDLLPRAFTHIELRCLIACATPMQRAAIEMVYDTGVRRGDVFDSCRWSNLRRDVLRIVQHKSGKRLIRRLRPTTIASCLFVRDHGDDRMIPLNCGMSKWRLDFKALCQRVGVNVIEPGLQMVRRSGASYVRKHGGDASTYLGHSPSSRWLADRFYIDGSIADEPPPLPPEIP
jgi:integrase